MAYQDISDAKQYLIDISDLLNELEKLRAANTRLEQERDTALRSQRGAEQQRDVQERRANTFEQQRDQARRELEEANKKLQNQQKIQAELDLANQTLVTVRDERDQALAAQAVMMNERDKAVAAAQNSQVEHLSAEVKKLRGQNSYIKAAKIKELAETEQTGVALMFYDLIVAVNDRHHQYPNMGHLFLEYGLPEPHVVLIHPMQQIRSQTREKAIA
jgi:flagellar biosynthesis GTPase FlhF